MPFPAPQPPSEASELASVLNQLEQLTQSLALQRKQSAGRGLKSPSLSESLLLSQTEIVDHLDRTNEPLGADSDEDDRERKAIA
jgi:hypothetical protein